MTEKQHRMTEEGPVEFTDDEQAAWEAEQATFAAGRLAAQKAEFVAYIYAVVDELYKWAIGNRGSEYELAETEARAYKLAGYTGAVPDSVQSWATPNGQTTHWAADDIIAAADQLRAVQVAVRQARLAAKVAGMAAVNEAALLAVLADWQDFEADIKAELGIS